MERTEEVVPDVVGDVADEIKTKTAVGITDNVVESVGESIYDRELSLKQKIHAVFDATGPNEEWYSTSIRRTTAALIFSMSFLMIVLSCTTFTIETMPEYYKRELIEFYLIEAVCISWFTFELLIRFFTCDSKKQFAKDLLNWVDLISILPFYTDLLVSNVSGSDAKADGLIVLRAVRLTRVFRVFKLSKYSEGIQMVFVAVKRSTDALSLLVFLMAIAMVLFGSGIYFAEQSAASWDPVNKTWIRKAEYGGPSAEHKIKSIPYGFWWCLVTVTTVGYGDMYPVTFWGHIVGTITMLTGLLIVAFPIIILGANFQDVQQEFKESKRKKKLLLEMTEMARSRVGRMRAAAPSDEPSGDSSSGSSSEPPASFLGRGGFRKKTDPSVDQDIKMRLQEALLRELIETVRCSQHEILRRVDNIEQHLSVPPVPLSPLSPPSREHPLAVPDQ